MNVGHGTMDVAMTELEICVDSVDSAVAAARGGAQRVELCSALDEGGLTPSLGMIRAVRASIGIRLHVMIRPRGGDFVYSEQELAIMRDDIGLAAAAGADGVVLGLLNEDSDVDVESTRALVELSRPMQVTFHRAFDMTRDPVAALEAVIQTGADRILTSGAEADAMRGRRQLQALVRAAGHRIRVMAGGSIRPHNAQQIVQDTGVPEVHSGLRHVDPSPVRHKVEGIHLGGTGADEYARSRVREEDVRSLRQKMDAAAVETAPAGVQH
jgi:copper homeostasis protein